MDVFEAIARRHSYRGEYLPQVVLREHLQQIVQAGIDAPSGCNAQTTSFVIVDDPELIAKIVAIVDRPFLKRVPALIFCVADHRPVYQGCSFAVEDCAAATENMLLTITALGYATVWLDGALRVEDRKKRIGHLLGVPPDKEVRVLLPVGVPKEIVKPREKLPFAKRAWFNGCGLAS